MFRFFGRKKHKIRYSPEHSPLPNDDNGEAKEEEFDNSDDLVRIDSLTTLTQELLSARNQIKVIIEQKKQLESLLLEKEKDNLFLIEKISNITSTFSQEKELLFQQQKAYLEEKKTLLQRIDLLQSELSSKEREYQELFEKIPPLHTVIQQKMDLLQQNKLLQEQHQALLKKLSDLEVSKHKVEQELSQEVSEHNKTKSLLEKERRTLLEQEIALISEPDSPLCVRSDINFFSPKEMTHQSDFIYPVDAGFKY